MVNINLFTRTTAVGTSILGSAYVAGKHNTLEGLGFFVITFFGLVLWFTMEKAWVEHKHSRNIRE